MESYRSKTSTDENSQVLRHKVSSVLPETSHPSSRVALGDVSTNVARQVSKAPLSKPAQRIQVYSEITNENDVPDRSRRPARTESARQALSDVKQNHRQRIASKQSHDIKMYDVDRHEIEEQDDDEEDSDDDIPEALMPQLSPEIIGELTDIYRTFYRQTLDEEDEDTYDVSMVAEYSPEIFNYIHGLEMKLRPNANYMVFQTELKWNMRGILVDWLVQVHSRFNLLPETLFLTVNYIDRFLSKRKVSLSRFQLVGAVALFIAAKYEEINCPSVQEIAYMVDHAYSVEDILRAERFMIDVLEFEMGWPGPMSFLRRTSKADNYEFETRTLAKYFLEITIMDYRFVASPPSWLAAGAHYLSRLLLNRGEWTPAHVYYSGYTSEQLKPLASALLTACRNPEEHHKAIFEKYQERRFRRSSLFVQEWFKMADS